MKALPFALSCSLLLAGVADARADVLFGPDVDAAGDGGSSSQSSPSSIALRPGFGARVGGYGFRRQSDGKWDDCRMNGVGLFGTLDVGRYFFGELAVDSYQSVKHGGDDAGMDRVSALTSLAAGLRMFPDFYVSPFVQVGTGAEWTRVDVGGQRSSGFHPIAFLGIGADLHVTRALAIGSMIRFLDMAHPVLADESSIRYQAPAPPAMEYQPAAQAQFFLRYVP